MLTGQIRNDIDKLWEKFWTGGITNPLTVIEQISYLMFARMLDMQEDMAERKANRTGKNFDRLFPNSPAGQLLRWKNFKNLSGKELHKHLKQNVFPFFAKLGKKSDEHDGLGNDGSAIEALGHIGEYMQDADLEIKNESVLVSAVEMVDGLPLTNSDVKGDIYEYLLSKLTTAGINGQFRTPRHIIDAMIELADPQPTEIVCDPACGTAGFLTRTMEYLNRVHSSKAGTFVDEEGNKHYSGDLLEPYRNHINKHMFWGFDFDTTMLRVSSMNMALHGVNGANILYQDSLSKSIKENFPQQEENFFDLILANPPFKGSLDETNTNPDVLGLVKTKKTELLFVAHILRSLKLGGRAAVIVPDGVLFGSSNAHQQLRKELIENNQLEGIVSLPSGVFKPYAGVSTAILMFTKGGCTEHVWFYDLQADGYSLDDKRTLLKGEDSNDLPDAIAKWKQYCALVQKNAYAEQIGKYFGDKTQKAFVVDAKDIVANKFDLSINRYKKVVYEEEIFEDPKTIIKKLKVLEIEIMADLNDLEGML
ncbi:type I restriction-modification system subunit M [Klebsiella michiganensis]|uniref:type I restriction-modification system subunit M n=3 Tax=Klebsiella michiganensis TaxID=1134687 RepID=UPI001917A120|nr:class I SAM-dependent DNA methyltransferase [Klebsiella michiganensis]MBK6270676.1 SAM-dependent DNA methyltransferase [Klebsiella michiganensis]MDI3171045.1 class I SAM-dependent DNA methyltransferase [Klebsiella michiganensis]UIU18506.1 type I restriction-modification system subunit M [Klebsiella michiganensis]UYB54883.1 type I restriction-modification system subunit M [Klebsiella michiganensis]HBM2961156.1 SAM-dependent DNA methyltransferase [Klebsiella michiganensis]